MQTSTKQTPKSCSCSMCTNGKHTKAGHSYMKHDERAYRHKAKIQLAENEEPILNSGPIGNYYD